MKLILVLAAAALASGAKLDRTYLPPSYAQTSGGNGQILEAPNSYPQDYQRNDFTQATASSFPANNYQTKDYNQINNFVDDSSFGQGNNNFDDFNQRPERPQAALERSSAILRQDSSNDGETYSYAYETSNGISAEENGEAVDGVKAQGGYSYTGDDGQVYSVRYTADENGFLPQGDHLPTPPPIPEEILKALEKNAEDEANGIYDDGSYSEGKYGDDQNGQQNSQQNSQQGDEAGYNYNNNANRNRFNAGGDYNPGNSFEISADDEDSVVTNNALLRTTQSGLRNQNGIEKAYLPPFQQNARVQAPIGGYNQNNGIRNTANRGFGGQNLQNNYLPPQQSNNRFSSNPNTRYNQNNGFRNGLNGQNGIEKSNLPQRQTTNNGQNGVNREYLPPGQFGQRNQQSRGNGVNRAYLPPGQFGQRNQNAGTRRPFSLEANIRNQSNEIQRSYLPPNQQRYNNEGSNNNFGNREYLPPSDNTRSRFTRAAYVNNAGFHH